MRCAAAAAFAAVAVDVAALLSPLCERHSLHCSHARRRLRTSLRGLVGSFAYLLYACLCVRVCVPGWAKGAAAAERATGAGIKQPPLPQQQPQ